MTPFQLLAKITGTYIERKVREKIREQANFDIHNLLPINHVQKIKCPVIFVHGEKDSLVLIKHSRALYEVNFGFVKLSPNVNFQQIRGEKDFIEVDVGHNDPRPDSVYEKVMISD